VSVLELQMTTLLDMCIENLIIRECSVVAYYVGNAFCSWFSNHLVNCTNAFNQFSSELSFIYVSRLETSRERRTAGSCSPLKIVCSA